MHVDEAIKTKQFWLLWVVLCLNVTAGIGVLGQASPMIQEMFPGVIGAAAAAGFVGLLSLANMLGRFVWSSCSDIIGRRMTYMIFFVLGAVLYALIPTTGRLGSVTYFVALLCGDSLDVRRRLRDDPRVSPRPVRRQCTWARFTDDC